MEIVLWQKLLWPYLSVRVLIPLKKVRVLRPSEVELLESLHLGTELDEWTDEEHEEGNNHLQRTTKLTDEIENCVYLAAMLFDVFLGTYHQLVEVI